MLSRYKNTIYELFSLPRNVVDKFVHSSDESQYTHPFWFILIGVVVVILLNSLLVNFSIEPELSDAEMENEQVVQIVTSMQQSSVWMSTWLLPVSILLLLVPSLSVAGVFFFRNELEGFYSNLVLNTYAVGAAIPALLLMIPVWMFIDRPLTEPIMNSILPGILIAGVVLWLYKAYFYITDAMGWVRVLSSFITGYILFILLNGFASSVVGYMVFAIARIIEISG